MKGWENRRSKCSSFTILLFGLILKAIRSDSDRLKYVIFYCQGRSGKILLEGPGFWANFGSYKWISEVGHDERSIISQYQPYQNPNAESVGPRWAFSKDERVTLRRLPTTQTTVTPQDSARSMDTLREIPTIT